MALKKKKPTATQRIQTWLSGHNALACAGVAVVFAASIFGLFLFITMAGFGASADFVYNQF